MKKVTLLLITGLIGLSAPVAHAEQKQAKAPAKPNIGCMGVPKGKGGCK